MSCFKACFGGGGSSPRDQKERESRYVVGGESRGGPSPATAADAAATSGQLNGNGAASLATASGAVGLGQAQGNEQGVATSSSVNVGSSTAVSSAANGLGSGGGEGGKGGGGKIVASVGFTGPESTQRPISTVSPLVKAKSVSASSDGNSSNNAEFQALTTPKSIFHTTAQNHVVHQEATRPPRAGKENLVKDSDSACVPGAKVFVSEQWLQVPYFSQFRGLTGVLTRRGVNGVTWYATFPGLLEQAFSTGMHGQHVLAYATESEELSQQNVAVERKQEDAHALGRNQPQQQQQPSPPKPRTSLPPLAAVGAVVPPPSAFVAQQPFAAHPPKPTAQDIHGMGSARKDRPSTARSRQLMGAPPLGSGRSQMSARGGKNLSLQVGPNAVRMRASCHAMSTRRLSLWVFLLALSSSSSLQCARSCRLPSHHHGPCQCSLLLPLRPCLDRGDSSRRVDDWEGKQDWKAVQVSRMGRVRTVRQ